MNKNDFVIPKQNAASFHCMNCGVLAQQYWSSLAIVRHNPALGYEEIVRYVPAAHCTCMHCEKESYWLYNVRIFPPGSGVDGPHMDLSEDLKADFEEARSVHELSPRASAALLRLLIQKLMKELGQTGKNINEDIKSLVASGLSPTIQKALDVCRVVGNNAVHPGEINLNDNVEVSASLFKLINIIVEEMITKPREIAELYDSLPESSRNAIDKRDKRQN